MCQIVSVLPRLGAEPFSVHQTTKQAGRQCSVVSPSVVNSIQPKQGSPFINVHRLHQLFPQQVGMWASNVKWRLHVHLFFQVVRSWKTSCFGFSCPLLAFGSGAGASRSDWTFSCRDWRNNSSDHESLNEWLWTTTTGKWCNPKQIICWSKSHQSCPEHQGSCFFFLLHLYLHKLPTKPLRCPQGVLCSNRFC